MVKIAHSNEIDWVPFEGPAPYRVLRRHLTARTDECNLGCSRYRLAPGMKACPAHYHYGNDEAIYILKGELTLWASGEAVILKDGDFVTLPRGTKIAHQVENRSDADVEYLCFSTQEKTDVILYPDSGKIGVFGGMGPGGSATDVSVRQFVKNEVVDYWDGEGSA